MMEYDALRAKVLDEYVQAGVSPEDVYVQSFVEADVDYWLANNDQGFKIVQLMGDYGGYMLSGTAEHPRYLPDTETPHFL